MAFLAQRAYLRAVAIVVPILMTASVAAPVQAQSADSSLAATYICRPATASETPTAKMIATPTQLVCKPVAMAMHMEDGSLRTIGNVTAKPGAGPDFSNALTPQQANAAYNRWLLHALDIDPATVHTP